MTEIKKTYHWGIGSRVVILKDELENWLRLRMQTQKKKEVSRNE
jgi:hypothetical protein